MFRARTLSCLVLALVVAGCEATPTEEEVGPVIPAQLQVVSGDGQVGVPGEELPEPLVVRALDDRGLPVRRGHVNWVVTEGGGQVYAGASLTDVRGYAREYWTLGPTTEPQGNELEVRAVDPATGEKHLYATFVATGLAPTSTWYRDADGDGWGLASETLEASSQPAGYASKPGDCDDQDAEVHPGAEEVFDGKDNNCDGLVDEGFSEEVCDGIDNDGDGVVDEGLPYCIDGVPAPHTDGETCDDGWYDVDGDPENGCESDTPPATTTWYRDADVDSWGDNTNTQEAETQPSGYVDRGGDCDDSDPSVYPGAPELADGKDNDCDGEVDEGT